MAHPTVSVVIPCYNAEAFISQTITSALSQSLSEIEVIVVNDGSTDGSEEIILSVSDPRLAYFKKNNTGVCDTRNYGLARAKAPFVLFLDADDVLLPDALIRLSGELSKHPNACAAYASYELFDSQTGQSLGNRIVTDPQKVFRSLLERTDTVVMLPSGVLLRKKQLQEMGGWDPLLSTAADYDLWLRISAKHPLIAVPEVLIRYRIHPAQMHRNIKRMKHDVDIISKKTRAAGYYRNWRHYRWCQARKCLRLAGSFYADASDKPAAVRETLFSLFYHPGPLIARLFGQG